jgi:hypothetical protein
MLYVMACVWSGVDLNSGSVWLAIDSGVAIVQLAKARPISRLGGI